MELRDTVQRQPVGREEMCLLVVDHLHPVLDRPQQPIALGDGIGVARSQMPPCLQRSDGIESRGDAQSRIAAAVDHLLDLDEEVGLTNTAATALQVKARAELRPFSEMIADAG